MAADDTAGLAGHSGAEGVALDDEDVDTVGGLVQKELGRIAEVGDVVEAHGLTITVRSLDGRGRNAGEMEVSREAGERR